MVQKNSELDHAHEQIQIYTYIWSYTYSARKRQSKQLLNEQQKRPERGGEAGARGSPGAYVGPPGQRAVAPLFTCSHTYTVGRSNSSSEKEVHS